MQRLNLQIHPCYENWEHMNASEKGRFCAVCLKQVIDLSNASKADILRNLHTADDSVCVRITRSSPVTLSPFWQKRAGIYTIILFLTLFHANMFFSKAQTVPTNKSDNSPKDVNKKQPASCTIRGSIKDSASKEYLPEAVVWMVQNGKPVRAVHTDSCGNFRFDLSSEELQASTFSLQVMYLGYKKLEMKQVPLNKRYYIFNLELRPQPLDINVQVIGYRNTREVTLLGVMPLQWGNFIESYDYDPFRVSYDESGTHISHKAIQKMP